MKAARVLRMAWPEIVCRGGQALRKRFDRAGLNGACDSFDGVFGKLARTTALDEIRLCARAGDLGGAARALFERWQATGATRFFEGASSAEVPALLRERDGDLPMVAAEEILSGRFDLLGYRGLHFGDPVDWHLDPVSGRRAPLVHWSWIDPLDAARVGDSKVVWELNRQQWLVTLGQAYRFTGDERYAEAFRSSVLTWMLHNPPGTGINWASSLEVAFRLISWTWALFLLRGSRALTAELYASVLEGVATHAAHVERYLSYYFSPNTHLTGEALGLCYAGFVFPELRSARRWRALGWRILVNELDRQVEIDGAYFERSTCYQRYTAEIYLHFLLLVTENGRAVPARVPERLERMVDVLLALRRPDGTMPRIGDADGGTLLPLARRAPDDFRGLFAIAAAVFRRADFAWAAEGASAEPLWLCGPGALDRLDSLASRPPRAGGLQIFAEGGWAVMRSGWRRRDHHLVLDIGPIGCPVSAGHGHADLLSVDCSVFGEPAVVDPGTYCYTAEPHWREFFRGTAAHSTVTVDGLGQARPRGPFGWTSRPAARLLRAFSSDALDVVDAEHRAYAGLPDPVVHRRRVLWIKPRYWVIVDDLAGAAEHEIALRFQLGPMDVSLEGGLWARATGVSGRGLLLCPFSPAALEPRIARGEHAPLEGWVSPDYGRLEPAPAVVYTARARLPVRIATIMVPLADALAPRLDVTLRREKAGFDGLILEGGREVVSFTEPESVSSPQRARLRSHAAAAAESLAR